MVKQAHGKPGVKAAGNAPPKKRLQPEARRAEILTKAIAFFAAEGFGGGTRELASQLGVTQPLLYRYFPSKDALIEAVYRAIYLDRWRPEWERMLEDRSLPIRERLQLFYESYTDTIFESEWLRIYLFSGLKGASINRLYMGFVEERILSRIIAEYRHEAGLPARERPSREELELAWLLHGGIFYYGVRGQIFGAPDAQPKPLFISNALDVFLEGLASVFGTRVRMRARQAKA